MFSCDACLFSECICGYHVFSFVAHSTLIFLIVRSSRGKKKLFYWVEVGKLCLYVKVSLRSTHTVSFDLFTSAADQPGPEHPAPEGRLPARRDPWWRGPGSDPSQGGQPHLHVLPGRSLHSLSNPVAPPLAPNATLLTAAPLWGPASGQAGLKGRRWVHED